MIICSNTYLIVFVNELQNIVRVGITQKKVGWNCLCLWCFFMRQISKEIPCFNVNKMLFSFCTKTRQILELNNFFLSWKHFVNCIQKQYCTYRHHSKKNSREIFCAFGAFSWGKAVKKFPCFNVNKMRFSFYTKTWQILEVTNFSFKKVESTL